MATIKLTKMVIPTFNRIITTAKKYDTDTKVNGIYDPSKSAANYMDIQTVVAVGPSAHQVEVGDVVSLSFARYAKRQYHNSLKEDDPSLQKMDKGEVYLMPIVKVDGVDYFMLGDNDVEFIIPKDGYKEVEDDSPLIIPTNTIITT